MKSLKQGLLLATLIVSQPLWACTENGKEGIVPENNLRIPVNAKRVGGITETQFNSIIDHYEGIYAPMISSMGGTLEVSRGWTDGTVNAYAQRSGKIWKVSMFGGLARHDTITHDGFSLVICHEIGHHIGGAPKKASLFSSPWASNEGQADYFSTLKCLRRGWQNDNNVEIVGKMTNLPQKLVDSCNESWSSAEDRAICIRGGMAGDSVARLFAALRTAAPAKFETPDRSAVSRTNDNHPAHQCRLDTYFQGALCEVSMNEDVESSSEVTGTCHGSLGHTTGLRPLCWFKPTVQ